MTSPDLVLLHAPSVYDFRQEMILYGPLADFAPSPFALEQYPIHTVGLAGYLERAGLRVRLLNLARQMLEAADFDAEAAIDALDPAAFSIDLHWLAHAQGALAVAQIVKTFHPRTPVILGGLAASYYHRELMNYPQVDYVLQGESNAHAWLQLIQGLSLGQAPDRVPGVTWRNRLGEVVENPIGPDDAAGDDWHGSNGNHDGGWPTCLAFARRLDTPVAVSTMVSGCPRTCATCSDSAYASQRMWGRAAPVVRSTEQLAAAVAAASRRNEPITVVGDVRQTSLDYAHDFLQRVRGFPNLISLDLFEPAPRRYLEDVRRELGRVALEIPLHSHDPRIRRLAGRSFDNPAVEQTIADALSLGFERIRLYFTIGVPGQDRASVMDTVAYCDDLLARFKSDRRLQPFVAPLVPFLDPGSLAFEEPERAGYRLLFRTLEEHRRALLTPSWKYALNYETDQLARDDIVQATYDSTVALAALRARHGVISHDRARQIEASIKQARALMDEIDRAITRVGAEELEDAMRTYKPLIDQVNRSGQWAEGRCDRSQQGNGSVRSGGGLGPLSQAVSRKWSSVKGWWRGRAGPGLEKKE